MIIRSKFSGKCKVCGSSISVGDPCEWNRGERGVKCARCANPAAVNDQPAPVDQTRKLEADGTVRMPFDREALTLLRAAPGARWVPERKVWTWSVVSEDLPRVLEIAGQLSLEVAPELVARAAEGTTEQRSAIARIEALESGSSFRLYDFQRAGVLWLALRERALLVDDMGLGKTVQALMALPEGASVLIICPASLKFNWQKEAQKWRPDFEVEVLSGKRKDRCAPKSGQILIINYDILPESWFHSDEEEHAPVHTVCVVDEAHAVKNYKTKRSQRVKEICSHFGQVWFLTGTPLMSRPTDLYGLLDVLGSRALGGWKKFLSLFNGHKGQWGGYVFGMPTPEASERLRRCMIRRTKEEVLPGLPKRNRVELWV